jgi:diadenosine tetraphosphate (Ap4A) HIT family hydrolase
MAYELHPRLAADTISLGHTGLCDIRLMDNSTWPWLILVPMREGIREIYQLSEQDQMRLLRDSSELSKSLMELFDGHKLNVAALGNMVPQLHVHHIVRYEGDTGWPGPVWGVQPPVPYSPVALKRRIKVLGELIAEVINKARE